MSSAMKGSDVRPNLATSSVDCMDYQTQSTPVSQKGFLTSLDKQDSLSDTQESVNEESKIRYRHFDRHFDKSDRDHESERSNLISEINADKSTQTRCDNSDDVSNVGKSS